jgi:L-asparaginase/Glu-tRNA(Gln) amidotransferase subunit D
MALETAIVAPGAGDAWLDQMPAPSQTPPGAVTTGSDRESSGGLPGAEGHRPPPQAAKRARVGPQLPHLPAPAGKRPPADPGRAEGALRHNGWGAVSREQRLSSGRAPVVLLACGGTITMSAEYDGILRRASPNNLVALIERLADAPVKLVNVSNIDSCDATPGHWSKVLTALRSLMSRYRHARLIITHGTDTLAWTAGMLASAGPWERPVAITGANIPLGAAGSDAETNLLGALATVSSWIPGVWISFASPDRASCQVLQGGFARKLPTTQGTFVGLPSPCAVVQGGRLVSLNAPRDIPWRVASTNFRKNHVLTLSVHPAIDLDRYAFHRDPDPPDVVVLELYASATAAPTVRKFVSRCREARIPVWACPPAPVDVTPYASTAELEAAGVTLFPTATVELLVPLACAGLSHVIPTIPTPPSAR